MGYELNREFIEKPHHWDPRRLYSQTGADWQYRVDFDRLRKERLQKTREQMEIHDLGALVLFAGANIRYVTGSYQGNWKYNINIRYVVLPRGGEPVFFETAGSDLHCAILDLPWIPQENIRPAITWQWAEGAVPHMAKRMVEGVVEVLKANKVEKEKIGIDNLDMPSLQALKDAGLKAEQPKRQVAENVAIARLLEELKIENRNLAIEHNGRFLEGEEAETTVLQPGDTLEIVRFVGGG